MGVRYIPVDSGPGLGGREIPFPGARSESPYDDQKSFKDYSFKKSQFYHVDKNLLIPGTTVGFSLFSHSDFCFEPLVEASEESPAPVPQDIRTLAGDIVIRKSDIPHYAAYIRSIEAAPLPAGQGTSRIKTVALRENSKLLIRELLENPRSGRHIRESADVVDKMITCILEDREAIHDLLSIRNFDYYTYTHSVNVAVLSIGLGIALSLPKGDIENLGMGAMLHDIGKSAVPVDVLNKQGRLTNLEFGILRTHVTQGEKILKEGRDIPEDCLAAVAQHHEKLTGTGYPRRLSGKAITLFGRIAAVADCYDALTTKRPYKAAYSPFDALSILIKETRDYDRDLLKAFITMLGTVEQRDSVLHQPCAETLSI